MAPDVLPVLFSSYSVMILVILWHSLWHVAVYGTLHLELHSLFCV